MSIRSLILISVLFAGVLFAGTAMAEDGVLDLGGSMLGDQLENVVNSMPVYSTILPGSAGALLCDIVNLIRCSDISIVIIATTIFIMGMMTINQKMTWGYTVMMTCFIVAFTKPAAIAKSVMFIGIFGLKLDFMTEPLGWFVDFCVCIF